MTGMCPALKQVGNASYKCSSPVEYRHMKSAVDCAFRFFSQQLDYMAISHSEKSFSVNNEHLLQQAATVQILCGAGI